jgi:putative ABC transport system permease protein
MLFAVVVSVATGLLIGIAPALSASRAELRGVLAEGGRGGTGAGRAEMRRVLVAAEVALALVLLVGAGLLVRSFRTLLGEELGFDPRGVLAASLTLPEVRYPEGGARAAYYDRVLAELRTIPGVESVGLINIPPLVREGFGSAMGIADRPDEPRYADYRIVGADYFRTMRIPLLAGRVFDERDDSTSTHVTVVNQALAERFWPGENPIGKRVRSLGMDARRDVWLTVIGVVGDVRRTGLTTSVGPQSFISYRQRPERATFATVVVRSRTAPASLTATVRDRLRAIDRDVSLELSTMMELRTRTVADRRFAMLVLAAFGAAALVLAAIGIYGVLAYTVTRRTREIGVRMALGARREQVLGMVLRDAMRPVVAGAVVGIAGSLALARLIQGLLYGVRASDPATLAAVTAILGVVGLVASAIPAMRASRIDPVVALRQE